MVKKTKKKKAKRRGKTVATTDLTVKQPLVAGVDIGSRNHWVCGPRLEGDKPNVCSFRTTTAGLNELGDWLTEQGVKSLAMESTGVYWIPLYELLEARGFEVLLVNARHVKNVPGRKSDMQDCQWLQLLHSYGLLRGSFRPKEDISAMRALRRQRTSLVETRTKATQWMQKALDQMNVRVHHAVTELTGATGMAIVRAIVAGQRDPHELAALRDVRCKNSVETIAEHLTGTWRQEHLFNLEAALRLSDHLQEEIASYTARLQEAFEALLPPERRESVVPPHPNPKKEKAIRARGEQSQRTALYRFAGVDLPRIDGISVGAAETILTEVGPDVSAFPTEHNFVSWLRLTPNVPTSGGRRLKKSRERTGASRVAAALRMGAMSLSRSRTALGARFRRMARRKDKAIATFEVARHLGLGILVYRMLRYGQDYVDEGEQEYNKRFERRRLQSLKKSANQLGYQLVTGSAQTVG